MTDRTLIKGGIVLTQDPALGEMADADVLIEDDKIAAVGRNLSADGARTIDASRDIVIPGFIDTHRHTWETSIRTCAPGLRADHLLQLDPRQVRARTTGPTTSTPPTCGARSSASTRASRRSSTGRTS